MLCACNSSVICALRYQSTLLGQRLLQPSIYGLVEDSTYSRSEPGRTTNMPFVRTAIDFYAAKTKKSLARYVPVGVRYIVVSPLSYRSSASSQHEIYFALQVSHVHNDSMPHASTLLSMCGLSIHSRLQSKRLLRRSSLKISPVPIFASLITTHVLVNLPLYMKVLIGE